MNTRPQRSRRLIQVMERNCRVGKRWLASRYRSRLWWVAEVGLEGGMEELRRCRSTGSSRGWGEKGGIAYGLIDRTRTEGQSRTPRAFPHGADARPGSFRSTSMPNPQAAVSL